jgi:hypothetical protein
LPALQRIVDAPADGRLRRAATEAASAVLAGLDSSVRLSELASEVEALRAECRGLRDRLSANGPV